ncbi:MAG: hypothetical protein QM784_35795 [Polyangiaceae bacterium]
MLSMIARAGFAQGAPEITIAITGRHAQSQGITNDNAILLQLGIREGRWVAGEGATTVSEEAVAGRAAPLLVQADRDLESAPLTDVPLDPLERDEVSPPEPSSSASVRSRGQKTKALAEASDVAFVLSTKFVEDAVQAALSAQGILPTLRRLEGLTSRARASALLPEVRFRAGRDVDQSLRLSPTEDDPYRYTQSGGVSFVLEGQATFRLSRLLFANEELGIERLLLAQARERQRVTEGLVEELLRWQQAYRVLASKALASSRVEAELFESTLRLDVMTGGWFSAHAPGDPAVLGRSTSAGQIDPHPSNGMPSRRAAVPRDSAVASSSQGTEPRDSAVASSSQGSEPRDSAVASSSQSTEPPVPVVVSSVRGRTALKRADRSGTSPNRVAARSSLDAMTLELRRTSR